MFTEKKATAERLLPFYNKLKMPGVKRVAVLRYTKTGPMEILQEGNAS